MAQLDQRQAVFGSVLHDGRPGAQRPELGRRVAQHINTDIGTPQLMKAGQTIAAYRRPRTSFKKSPGVSGRSGRPALSTRSVRKAGRSKVTSKAQLAARAAAST